jgi:hypothetical protein
MEEEVVEELVVVVAGEVVEGAAEVDRRVEAPREGRVAWSLTVSNCGLSHDNVCATTCHNIADTTPTEGAIRQVLECFPQRWKLLSSGRR